LGAKIKVGERLMGVASLAVDRLAAQRSLPHLFVVQIQGCFTGAIADEAIDSSAASPQLFVSGLNISGMMMIASLDGGMGKFALHL
jgi:hypothetical protein